MLCFCFRQKTAYEMRIGDWSSDVCSSDLVVWFSFMPPRSFDLWQPLTFENYRVIFAETFYRSFLWSLGLAVVATSTLVAICYPVAYGLAKLFGRWANLVTLLLVRSEEHTSELQSLMRISYAVFCLTKT